jgi:di/tricarboxylate transporter
LIQNNNQGHENKDSFSPGNRNIIPACFGLFLIVLGLALLVATNDMLNLGSIKDYFTRETALVFIGVLLILNLQFTEALCLQHWEYGLCLIIWTMSCQKRSAVYWPSVVIIAGLFIFSSFLNKTQIKSKYK